jgi:hypothetical protein
VLFCGAALAVLVLRPGGKHLPNTEDMPTYPGAREWTVREKNLDDYRVVYKTIPFNTNDPPVSVLAFYEDALVKDGWSLHERKSANELRFQWSTEIVGAGNTLLYYWVDVKAEQSKPGETSAQISLNSQER